MRAMADETPFVYHLEQVIGRGGFGTVYRAELRGPSGFSKIVAVKLLNHEAAANTDLAQRLRDEARMLGLVQHRAIVQVDRLVQLDGRWAVVMEFVPGFDLQAILDRHGPLPPAAALECIEEVASALHVAYAAAPGLDPESSEPMRLVHRDVKPANIRITPSGAVKLLDFGIARAHFPAREARTESLRFGSMNYMSPLRLAMEDDGHAGDVYALGAVLYEMITGRAVGMASHHETAHHKIVEDALERLHAEGASADLVALVGAALAYEADDRPDARTFMAAARHLRTEQTPRPSLLEWVDHTFPDLVANAPTPDDDTETGRQLYEVAPSITNPTLGADLLDVMAEENDATTERAPRFHPDALIDPLRGGPTTPQRRRRPRRWAPVVALLAIVGLASAAVWLAQPSSSDGRRVASECEQVPLDTDREPIEAIDGLFRGWQKLDIDQVDGMLALDFQRRDGTSGAIQQRDTFLAQREAIFNRLVSVTWNGPVHDGEGFGIPTVIDGVAVRCADSNHLRVVVRYNWTVTSQRTGRHTVETNVVDAYEIDLDGLITSNLDYADLEAATAWRDACCIPGAETLR